MDIKDLLKSSWIDFKVTLLGFIKLAWWPLLVLVAIPNVSFYMEVNESSWTAVFLDFIESIATVFLALYSFSSLFKSRDIEISITSGKVFILWFTSVFIAVASSIATLFLVIPGLIILALSIFVPIFILYKNEGPIEAIAFSSSYMQDQTVRLTVVFTVLWGIPLIVDYVLLYFPLNSICLEIASVLLAAICGYFIYSVAFNAYFELKKIHDNSMQSRVETAAD